LTGFVFARAPAHERKLAGGETGDRHGLDALLEDIVEGAPWERSFRRQQPSYQAPEQIREKTPEVGPATDVYALGAILYKLLTNQRPALQAQREGAPGPPEFQEPLPPSQVYPMVPAELEEICLKCLRPEPARRYASAEA